MKPFLGMSFDGPEGQEDMPYLLTAGPVTTSRTVKLASLADWSQGEGEFQKILKNIQQRLLQIAGCDDAFDCLLLPGSETFALEAALGTFAPSKRKKTLVISNGRTGEQAARVLEQIKRPHEWTHKSEQVPLNAELLNQKLGEDVSFSHVFLVHCETSSGIVNPLRELAQTVKQRECVLIVDASVSFGALDVDMLRDNIDVLVASPSASLQGIAGFSFVIARRNVLEGAKGQCHSPALDLYEIWKASSQFQLALPTHVLAAFHQALQELDEEGGVQARCRRYALNAETLTGGLTQFGVRPLLVRDGSGPIIQTFLSPRDTHFDFKSFSSALRVRGFVIAPGQLAQRDSFRVGTIGHINEQVVARAVDAIKFVLRDMGVKDMLPKDL